MKNLLKVVTIVSTLALIVGATLMISFSASADYEQLIYEDAGKSITASKLEARLPLGYTSIDTDKGFKLVFEGLSAKNDGCDLFLASGDAEYWDGSSWAASAAKDITFTITNVPSGKALEFSSYDETGSSGDVLTWTSLKVYALRSGEPTPTSEEPSTVSEDPSEEDPGDIHKIDVSQDDSAPEDVSKDEPSEEESVVEPSEEPSQDESIPDASEDESIDESNDTPSDILPGDAVADGNLDMKDVLAIRKVIAKMDVEGFNAANADFNGDSALDMKDVLGLRRQIAGL